MRVQIVDPPAYSPPYDHALAAALARAGADVELLTSVPAHGEPPAPDGYRLRQDFYPRATRGGRGMVARRVVRLAEHVPGMLAARDPRAADVVHYQWLTLEPLDAHLLARGVPHVFTSHNVLRRGSGRLRRRAVRHALERMDALIAHTDTGGRALIDRFGVDPARVHTIPHGAFDELARLPERALPPELAAVDAPVVLCFGVLRPYKGVDVLVDAFAGIEDAELWVVGRPWMDVAPLRAAAARSGARVRFVDRFVPDEDIPALFRRADLVALPYRRIDQSGVLYTALAFGKAMVLSDVGGFAEVGRVDGAAELVAPGDPAALHHAIAGLLADPARRAELESAAAAAAAGRYSWDDIARRTLDLYGALQQRPGMADARGSRP